METDNLIIQADSYKASHFAQYPPGTTKVYSYLESRGGELPYTVFFGLQYLIRRHLTGKVVTQDKIDQAAEFWQQHLGAPIFHKAGWQYILDKHDGHLPLEIRAVPEGTKVPLHNVLMTIHNTDPNCFWLTNFIETLISRVWYPITIASNSAAIKQDILGYIRASGANEAGIDFMLHDFGYRGVSSEETARIGGASHLVSFMGTDNVGGIQLVREYYNTDAMVAFSVPATEHSTMTPWGLTVDDEIRCVNNLLDIYPTGIVSIVADSRDVFRFAREVIGNPQIRDRILARDGKVVVRPDSGDPVEVNRKLLHILWDAFGGTETDKGYRVLDPHIGLIQGDGIDRATVTKILQMAFEEGFAATNFVFGSGGGLLQKFDRDTLKFAIKCSFAMINGAEVNVQKDPITASDKKSKTGRLKLAEVNGTLETFQSNDPGYNQAEDILRLKFYNGVEYNAQTFEDIRARANK